MKTDLVREAAWKKSLSLVKRYDQLDHAAWDKKWETVDHIVSHQLYLAGGYKTAKDFYEKELQEMPRMARLNQRVAKWATPEDEATYTVRKLDAILSHLEARKTLPPKPKKMNWGRVKISFGRGASAKTRAASACSVADIQHATSLVLAKTGRAAPTHHMRDAIRVALAKHPSLRDQVEVHERNGEVTLRRIPTASLALVGRALLTVK